MTASTRSWILDGAVVLKKFCCLLLQCERKYEINYSVIYFTLPIRNFKLNTKMPPKVSKQPAGPSKKTEQKKKEKVIEVSTNKRYSYSSYRIFAIAYRIKHLALKIKKVRSSRDLFSR